MKESTVKILWKWIKKVLHWYWIYVLVSLLVAPLIQQAFTPVSAPSFSSRENTEEQAAVVTDNEDAMVWRLRLIDSAQSEIIYTTFELHDDQSTREVIAALYKAAERGVDVKFMADSLASIRVLNHPYLKALAGSDHAEVKFYNPVNLLFPARLQYRMHDKYMIVDGKTYLLGGRNTFDLFIGNYTDNPNIDYEVLVSDPLGIGSVNDLEAYFDNIWNGKYVRSLSIRHPERMQETAGKMLDLCEELPDRHPGLLEDKTVENSTIPVDGVRLLSGQTQPYSKDPVVAEELLGLCKEHSDVKMQTPYIICNRTMYKGLEELTGQGTHLEIMTNAVEGGANPFGCTDYLNQKGRILKTGSTVCEWLGANSLHGKMLVLDDETIVVGSWNLDMRSAYLDTELMLVVDSKQLTSQLNEQYMAMRDSSRIVSPDGSYVDGSQYTPVTMPVPKKIFYGCLRVFSFFFRYML